MKPTSKKTLVFARATVRILSGNELRGAAGGFVGSQGGRDCPSRWCGSETVYPPCVNPPPNSALCAPASTVLVCV